MDPEPAIDGETEEQPTPEGGEAPAEVRPRRTRLTRRRLLALMGGGALMGGAYKLVVIDPPMRLKGLTLSMKAKKLIETSWEGIDPAKVIDIHVHVLGLGVGGSGCFVHPDATSILSPVRWVKTRFYKGAAGIYDDERADPLYMERLVDLCTYQKPRGRFLLMAFDKHHTSDGKPDLDQTEFFTPFDYVVKQVEQHPELFLPCASVHPYRPDALDEVRRCKELGAVAMKWLPNAMGFDPADPRCDPYYELLAELKLPIISHGGEEQAVHADEAQELGNPLRLRRALDHGIKVVIAHCASMGTNKDLDEPKDASGNYPSAGSYDLFRRVLEDERYQGRVFGGISAMTQFNRCEEPLTRTIVDTAIHGKLVNGSDYPLPAIDPLIRTGLLVELGYITEEEREVINEIYAYNPLTFDFVLKRCLKVERDGVTHRMPASAFETAHLFGL